MSFKKGARVEVHDEALAMLREIVGGAPNNTGTVDHVSDGFVYITFDGPDGPGTGNCAPYSEAEVRAASREQTQ